MTPQSSRSIKSIYKTTIMLMLAAAAMLPDVHAQGVEPYRFERVNEHNFSSQGWKEQEINVGLPPADESDHISIVCGPENDSDPRLIKGSITMDLPTSGFPTLRRVRLRRGGYSGTLLADLTELKYSTYVVDPYNFLLLATRRPAVMVLQVDVDGDTTKDFNIVYVPEEQGTPQVPWVPLNTWQQWDALHGIWDFESALVPVPQKATIAELLALYPNARIIDTPPSPNGANGEGVRFTVGPPNQYADDVSYLDDIIIGTSDQQRSTLFDFTCDSSQ